MALIADLTRARSDFTYYQGADSKAYANAMNDLYVEDKLVVEAIRIHSRPFGETAAPRSQIHELANVSNHSTEQSTSSSSTKRLHDGRIIDASTKTGIIAEAYAYASPSSNNLTGSVECPTYLNSLDMQRSSSGGDFTFHISPEVSSYLAVYCAHGYAARIETANDNSSLGDRIAPDPLKLYPRESRGDPRSVSQMGEVVIDTVENLRANLDLYSKENPKAFLAAIESADMPADDRALVHEILVANLPQRTPSEKGNSWPVPAPITNHETVLHAVVADLNHARSDMSYFAIVDGDAFGGATRSMPSNISKMIEELRSHSEPTETDRTDAPIEAGTGGNVRGTVRVVGARSPENIAVYIDSIPNKVFEPPKEHQTIYQADLAFRPHMLVIQQGTTVDFVNRDNVGHNVYWPAINHDKKLAHNLGTWPQGFSKPFTFTEVGSVPLYDNIHPEMSGYILVVPTPYFAVTDKDGNFVIKNVPPGQYTLKTGSESGKPTSQPLTVTSATVTVNLTVTN
jgi:plastocyanin